MLLRYLFMFSMFSFIGWILEFFYRGIRSKRILNPGFMSGCVVPIYGFGAVICDIICNMFSTVESDYNVIWTFLIAIVILSTLELCTGLILDKIFHMKLWDYSKYKFNIKGYICLQYSMMWGILFLIYYNFLYSNVINMGNLLVSNMTCIFILGLFYGVFLVDLSVSIGLTSNIIKYSRMIAESINLENLRSELKKNIGKRKFVYSMFPYATTNRYLKEKIKKDR